MPATVLIPANSQDTERNEYISNVEVAVSPVVNISRLPSKPINKDNNN